MNEEELREIIEAKNKPIRDVVELSKHFRGRRNCIVFLTESFRIDLDNRMSKLAELKENSISKNKISDKIKELENMRNTSITSEAFNIFNGEIIVLKELLGG